MFLFMVCILRPMESFEGQGNFVASPEEWAALERNFRRDPIFKAIGGYAGPYSTAGGGSDWSTPWRGPMISNGWKY